MVVTALVGIALVPLASAACNPNISLTRPDERYVDNQDGTVTDSITGLMWKQCPEGMSTSTTPCDSGSASTFTWQQALQQASNVNTANTAEQLSHMDWRLPDMKELKSLSEMACFDPAINTNFFPGTPAAYFWTSTPVASSADHAWGVGFFYGGDRWGKKDDARHVWLVRSVKYFRSGDLDASHGPFLNRVAIIPSTTTPLGYRKPGDYRGNRQQIRQCQRLLGRWT